MVTVNFRSDSELFHLCIDSLDLFIRVRYYHR